MLPTRALALAALALLGTSVAGAQSVTPRIAGPTPTVTSLHLASPSLPRVSDEALGHAAMHRAGRRPNTTGGIIGFVVGAAAGATVGCLANKDDYGVFCGGQDDTKVVVGAVIGGAVGAAVGALVFARE